jgi:hypothetical protein
MKKELIKIIASTALCVGVSCTAFLGINQLALSAATGGTQHIPLITPTVSIPATPQSTSTPPPHAPQNLTITVIDNGREPAPNALSPQAAATLGAQYVYDMFEASTDGMFVGIWYAMWDSQTRPYWLGQISSSEAAFFDNEVLFSFAIDAITGERIDISRIPERSEGELTALMVGDNRDAFMVLRNTPVEPPARLEPYLDAATAFAQRHFANTEVASIGFTHISPRAVGLDEAGNLVVTAHQLGFIAYDSTGRSAIIAIDEASLGLIFIHTQHNDIVPDFNTPGPAER